MTDQKKVCPAGECDGSGDVWTDPHVCTCGAGPGSYMGMHEPGCGAEPCPAGCWQKPEREQAMRAVTSGPPRCWHCGDRFPDGYGYGDGQQFCSETCADSFRQELGA
jgi:hypothetical protein